MTATATTPARLHTTFDSEDHPTRVVTCSTPGCYGAVYQWLSRWGWLNRCHKCAAAEWDRQCAIAGRAVRERRAA